MGPSTMVFAATGSDSHSNSSTDYMVKQVMDIDAGMILIKCDAIIL